MGSCGQKLSWPNLRLHHTRSLEELRKTVAAPTDSRAKHTSNTRYKRHRSSQLFCGHNQSVKSILNVYYEVYFLFVFSFPLSFSICRSYIPSRHLFQTHNPKLYDNERYNSDRQVHVMLHNTQESPQRHGEPRTWCERGAYVYVCVCTNLRMYIMLCI